MAANSDALNRLLAPSVLDDGEKTMDDFRAVLESRRGALDLLFFGVPLCVDDVYWGWLATQLKQKRLYSDELEAYLHSRT